MNQTTVATDMETPAVLQVEDELKELIKLLKQKGTRSYLEVGSRYGGSFDRIVRGIHASGKCLAVDFPGGNFGDSKSAHVLLAAIRRLQDDYYDADCVLGPSTAPEVFKRVMEHAPYDAVMLDAGHAYGAIKQDFLLYKRAACTLILHDIAAPAGHTSKLGLPIEVPKLWQEIKNSGDGFIEIIAPGSLMGIGVLFLTTNF